MYSVFKTLFAHLCFKEKDKECDDIFINRKEETFIISNGDLRKLYVKRPPAMELITFAQFVVNYYTCNPQIRDRTRPAIPRSEVWRLIHWATGPLPTIQVPKKLLALNIQGRLHLQIIATHVDRKKQLVLILISTQHMNGVGFGCNSQRSFGSFTFPSFEP